MLLWPLSSLSWPLSWPLSLSLSLSLSQDFIDDLALAVEETLPLTEERPKSDINEGRPVSLRVVNDLVQLRSKDQEIEFGPVRYEVRRTGLTPNAELINGRIAMTAITLALALSLDPSLKAIVAVYRAAAGAAGAM